MAILEVKKFGDPVLRKTAEPYQDGELTDSFVTDMVDTMKERDGVGLAAPQVGISKRLIVTSDTKDIFIVVNPEIIAFSEQTEIDVEGCLSLPGIQGRVERPIKIVVRGRQVTGEKFEITARGLLARVFQHEIDHLNGVLFIDRSDPDSLLIAQESVQGEGDTDFTKTNVRGIITTFKKKYHENIEHLQFEPDTKT